MIESSPRSVWRGIAAKLVLVTLLLSALTFLAMRPAMSSCNSTIMGAPGDATSGGVWLAWTYKHDQGSPMEAHTKVSAAPSGEKFWQPTFFSALSLFGLEWAFTHVTGPTCSWNLTLFFGFILSGLAMFGLAYWLTRSMWAALFAMYAFTFSPYRQVKVQGHVAYVHAEPIVLLLLACFLVWQRPTWPRTVAAAAALALCGYTDGYYILIGGVAFAAFHLAAFAYATFVERWQGRDRRRTVLGILGSGALAVVLMAPLALALVTQGSEIQAQTARSRLSLFVYGARPLEYLLPSPFHPVFSKLFKSYQETHLHASSFSEQNVYLGWVVMILAAVAVVGLVRTWRRRALAGGDIADLDTGGGVPLGFAVVVLGFVALAALAFSAPDPVQVGGLSMPAPSAVVYAFSESWRVYARFFILAHAALVALAAIGLARLMRGRPRAVQGAAFALVIALVAFDQLPFPAPGHWTYKEAPEAYFYVASRPERVLAEYPLLSQKLDPNHVYLTYQPVHGKAMVNVRNQPSQADQIAQTLGGLSSQGTIEVLRAYGVGLVIVHPGMLFGGRPMTPAPPGLELLRSYRYDEPPTNPAREHFQFAKPYYDADVYRVLPGPKAAVAVAEESGFFDAEPEGWTTTSWTQSTATIRLVALDKGVSRATVSFHAAAFGPSRQVSITQGGVEVYRGTVPASDTVVSFTAAVGPPLVMTMTPGAIAVRQLLPEANDDRSVAVTVSGFSATPA